jgi:hypothetical protein
MKMCNVGGVDRDLRIIIGLAFLVLGFFAPFMEVAGVWQIVFWAIGAIGVVTGSVTVCPLYALLRFNTCRPKPSGVSAYHSAERHE